VLTIEDDGRGFDPATVRHRTPGGFGLLSIEERVADARGWFSLDSAPGRGTRITIELPASPATETRPADAEGQDGRSPAAADRDSHDTHPARG
jgi:signal transduction histidine kinase